MLNLYLSGALYLPDGAAMLRQYKNVVITGPKNITELPDYVKHFSVGIIPFKRSEFIKTVYPLKINEYFAAGVPVVTTNFSYLDDFKCCSAHCQKRLKRLNKP